MNWSLSTQEQGAAARVGKCSSERASLQSAKGLRPFPLLQGLPPEVAAAMDEHYYLGQMEGLRELLPLEYLILSLRKEVEAVVE